MNENVVQITYENAQKYLIEESKIRPVLIDFWADWCAPCKALLPVLEKLANEYAGGFMLAKLNVEELQEISEQFGVQSLPTVVMMKDGQPVDAFQGAQPESVVRQFLEKHLPKPWDRMHEQAKALILETKLDEAVVLLRDACRDSSSRADIAMTLAQVCLQLNYLEEAKNVLDGIYLKDRDSAYEQLTAQLELQEASAKTPEICQLEEKLNADPDNLELAYELAIQFNQNSQHREALELLFGVLQSDRNFRDGGARKIYLDMLATLGKGNPLAIEFQKKIYALLY